MAVMLITHDLGVVAETAQRVVVMYAGQVVEEATVEELFAHAAPSLHAGPDPLDPAPRHGRAAQGAARGDRRHRAEPARAGAGLPLRAALPLRACRVHAPRRRRCAKSARGHKVRVHLRHLPGERRAAADGMSTGSHDARAACCCRSRTWSSTSRSRAACSAREVDHVHAVDGVSFDLARRRDARPRRRIGLRQDRPPAAASCA